MNPTLTKKINKKFVLNLFLGLVVTYSIMGLFAFNKYFCFVDEKINSVFIFLIPGIISMIFSLHFKKACGKLEEYEKFETEEEKNKFCKSNKRKFIIINTVLYVLLSIIMLSFMNYIFESNYISDYKYEKVTNFVSDSYIGTLIVAIIISACSLIPSNIIIKRALLNKKKNSGKILKVISNCFLYIITAIVIFISIYSFIDIPEFRLEYDDLSSKIDISYGSFVDARDAALKDEMKIPTKIWGKDVASITKLDPGNAAKINIPSTLNYSDIKLLNIIADDRKELLSSGESQTWYIENNVIYSLDGKEITVPMMGRNDDGISIKISENVEQINGIHNLLLSDNVNVNIDEGNTNFYLKDNIIFSKKYLISEYKPSWDEYAGDNVEYGYVLKKDGAIGEIILKDYMSENLVIISSGKYDVVYPKELTKKINLYTHGMYMNSMNNFVSNFIVDEENINYATYNGGLYNKDFTELYAVTGNTDIIYIPKTLKKINSYVLEDSYIKTETFTSRINKNFDFEIEEGNESFIYEDDILYNYDKTEILYSKQN